MNVAMMDLICPECGRRRGNSEGVRRLDGRESVAHRAFERDFRDFREDGQIEEIERCFGRDWKW